MLQPHLSHNNRHMTFSTWWVAGVLALLLAFPTFATPAAGEPLPSWRVFVARSPTYRDGNLHEEHLREIADAGFNVLAHRFARPEPDRIDHPEIQRVARLCNAHGLRYVSWMRGSVIEEGVDPHLALTWQDGTVQERAHGPLSPRLWSFLEESLTYLAGLGTENACAGAFLDFENYAPGKRGNLYPVSYDRHALTLFAEARAIAPPPADLPGAAGPAWIARQGLDDAFIQWQRATFAERARQLRQKIDRIHPAFQVGIYMNEGMTDLFARAMATAQAPVIFAPAISYGRASPLLPQAEALQANQTAVLQGIARTRQSHDHFLYLPGVMPAYRGSDPEFNGKNIVASASVADGYWLWIELRRDGHEAVWQDYMRWMTLANQDLVHRRHRLHREPRVVSEFAALAAPPRQTDRPQIGVYDSGGGSRTLHQWLNESGQYEAHLLAGFSAAYLAHFDALLLQNFNVALPAGSRIHQVLDDYVRQGGRVLLAHNTLAYLESPFPQIGERAEPTEQASAAGQVLDRRMRIRFDAPSWPAALQHQSYTAGFGDHLIFHPGPSGQVLLENHFGQAVGVAGSVGQGRVILMGCHWGYGRKLEGTERTVAEAMLHWLTAH